MMCPPYRNRRAAGFLGKCGLAALLLIPPAAAWPHDHTYNLPYGAQKIRVQGETYYYSANDGGGYFYRRENGSYLRVEPPLGARVNRPPATGSNFSIGEKRYFLSGTGTFFRYDAHAREFVVVSPPSDWRNHYRGPLAPEKSVYSTAYPKSYYELRPRDDEGAGRGAYCRALRADREHREEGRDSNHRGDYRRCLREIRRRGY